MSLAPHNCRPTLDIRRFVRYPAMTIVRRSLEEGADEAWTVLTPNGEANETRWMIELKDEAR